MDVKSVTIPFINYCNPLKLCLTKEHINDPNKNVTIKDPDDMEICPEMHTMANLAILTKFRQSSILEGKWRFRRNFAEERLSSK